MAALIPHLGRGKVYGMLMQAIPKQSRKQFAIDLVSGSLTGLFMGMTMPFVGLKARQMGASPEWIASIQAAMPLGSLLSLYAADKVSHIGAIHSIILLMGLGRIMFILTPLFGLILPDGRALVAAYFLGMCISMMAGPAYVNVMGQVYPNRCRAAVMGYVRIGVGAASIVGALAGGALLDKMSPFTFFSCAGIIGFAGTIIFSRISPNRIDRMRTKARFSLKAFLVILRYNKLYTRFLANSIVCGLGNMIVLSIAPLYFKDVLAMSAKELSLFAMGGSAMTLIGLFRIGAVIDRTRPLHLISLLQLMLIFIPLSYLLSLVHPFFLAIPLVGASLLYVTFELTIYRVVYTLTRGEKQIARYQGLWAAGFGIRGLLAPLLASALLRIAGGPSSITSYIVVFITSSILITIGAISNLRLAEKARSIDEKAAVHDRTEEQDETS